MRKALIAVLILAPLLGILGFIANLEMKRHDATPWRIAIEGYDPRDILRGHYLTFQYQWAWKDGQPASFPEELCLTPDPATPGSPLASPRNTGDDCTSILSGQGIRYGKVYIPEEHAPALERKLQNGVPMAVDIKVGRSGDIMIEGLVVNSLPLKDYLQQNTGENP